MNLNDPILKQFTGWQLVDDLAGVPADVDIETGHLRINKKMFSKYPDHWQHFILLHELGHYLEKTTSEKKAHNFAIKNFKGSQEQLVEIVKIISNESHPPLSGTKAAWWQAVAQGVGDLFKIGYDWATYSGRKYDQQNYERTQRDLLAINHILAGWSVSEQKSKMYQYYIIGFVVVAATIIIILKLKKK